MSDAARAPAERLPLRVRLALYDLDGVTLLVLPAVLFVLALFVYPFLYGFVLSFEPKKGGWLANYAKFFSDPFLYDTIGATLRLAVPATLLNVLLSMPVALRVRLMRNRRAADHDPGDPDHARHRAGGRGPADLSRPARLAQPHAAAVRPVDSPVRLVHNYWGVMLSLM